MARGSERGHGGSSTTVEFVWPVTLPIAVLLDAALGVGACMLGPRRVRARPSLSRSRRHT